MATKLISWLIKHYDWIQNYYYLTFSYAQIKQDLSWWVRPLRTRGIFVWRSYRIIIELVLFILFITPPYYAVRFFLSCYKKLMIYLFLIMDVIFLDFIMSYISEDRKELYMYIYSKINFVLHFILYRLLLVAPVVLWRLFRNRYTWRAFMLRRIRTFDRFLKAILRWEDRLINFYYYVKCRAPFWAIRWTRRWHLFWWYLLKYPKIKFKLLIKSIQKMFYTFKTKLKDMKHFLKYFAKLFLRRFKRFSKPLFSLFRKKIKWFFIYSPIYVKGFIYTWPLHVNHIYYKYPFNDYLLRVSQTYNESVIMRKKINFFSLMTNRLFEMKSYFMYLNIFFNHYGRLLYRYINYYLYNIRPVLIKVYFFKNLEIIFNYLLRYNIFYTFIFGYLVSHRNKNVIKKSIIINSYCQTYVPRKSVYNRWYYKEFVVLQWFKGIKIIKSIIIVLILSFILYIFINIFYTL